MWAGPSKRYYDILRGQEREHKSQMLLTRSAAAAATDREGVQHVSNRRPNTALEASGKIASSALPPVRANTFADPSERQTKVIDPVQALRLPATAIKGVTDLVFRRKGVTALHANFLLFEGLEVLVLEGNKLSNVRHLMPHRRQPGPTATHSSQGKGQKEQLTGPRGCVRLRQLFLGDNCIEDLADTDIPRLASLELLSLCGNHISHLARVVDLLKQLHSLTVLDLSGNPAAEEQGYRSYVIRKLPQVTVLDQLAITEEERREAAAAVHHSGTAKRQQCTESLAASTTRTLSCSHATSLGVECLPQPATVAFGSSYHPGPSKDGGTGRERQQLWGESACVRLMVQQRARSLRAIQQNADAAEQAELDRVSALEDTRAAFHAVWALSHPGMPLSAAKLKDWSTPAPKPGEESASGAAVAVGPVASVVSAPHAKGEGRKQHGNMRASTVCASTVSFPMATHPAPMDAASIAKLQELLPRVGSQVALATPVEGAAAPHPAYHQSVLFDALLGRKDAVREKTVTAEPGWREESVPEKERLRNMASAVEASQRLVQMNDPALRAPSFPLSRPVMPYGGGGASSRTSTASFFVAEEPTEMRELLTTVQANKAAMIPAPWEGSGGDGEEMQGPVVRLSPAELQEYLVWAACLLLLPQECRAMETEYGAAEVLQVLRLAPPSLAHGSPGSGASPPGSSRGKRLSQQQHQQQQSSGKKGRNAQVGTGAPVSLLLADEALLALMESPALHQSGGAIAGGELGLPSVRSNSTSASPHGGAAATATASAETTSAQAAAPPPGLVGHYTRSSVDAFWGLLRRDSGAWGVDTGALLHALVQAHGVDTESGRLVQTLGQHVHVADRNASISRITITSAQQSAIIEDGKPTLPHSRKGALASSKRKAGGASSKHGTKDADAITGVGPADAAAQAAADSLTEKKAFLTVNNLIGALVCFIPFVETRVAYFRSQALRCAALNSDAEKGEARVWFSRAQHAAVHLERLKSACRMHLLSGGGSIVPAGPANGVGALAVVPMRALATREVNAVGTAFHAAAPVSGDACRDSAGWGRGGLSKLI